MPPRATIQPSESVAVSSFLREMADRINELSRIAGLPPLRSRIVTSVPTDAPSELT